MLKKDFGQRNKRSVKDHTQIINNKRHLDDIVIGVVLSFYRVLFTIKF